MAVRPPNTRSDSFIRTNFLIDGIFLDINTLPKIRKTEKDEEYVIGHGYDERPDLLAHEIYGNSRLWWVFALRNPDILLDPIRDFTAGKTIILPSEAAVKNI